MRGLCLSNSLEIREIHNEFGNLNELLAFGEDDEEGSGDSKSKDPFHFVAFIHKNGKIYELDGLAGSPKLQAECDESAWEGKVLEIIKSRVNVNSAEELRFNLMALCADRRELLKAEISELNSKIVALALSESSETCKEQKTSWLTRRFQAQQEFDEEEAKWSRYRKDWANRKREYQNSVQEGPKAPPKDIKLSSQVQDLLKSMTAKGLIPK